MILTKYDVNFNSYMVRLRATKSDAEAIIYFYFNSYMVRLRVTGGIFLTTAQIHFNSYMVRLRGQSLKALR